MITYKKIKISYTVIFAILISLYAGFVKELFLIYSIILLHELGHIFYIKLFQGQIINIKISIYGVVVKTDYINNLNKIKKFLINTGRPDYKFNINYCF